uniref:Sentrin-specific protease 8 n=1 Tax=Cacopsylla melanoneura TaxID=428564 RepID=A0A8D8YM40_9HEMI
MTNKVVLSYHDTVLHQSDIAILQGSDWLNDEIIAFYLEYLEREVYPNKGMLFISPQVTQCLKQVQKEDLKIFLDPILSSSHHHILFALNDSDSLDKPGGSHWSLLIYNRTNDEYFHADSFQGTNSREATKLAHNLHSYFNPAETNQPPFVKQVITAQQKNGYDCGLYLLANLEMAVKVVQAGRRLDELHIDQTLIKSKRASILSLIYLLQRKHGPK